MSANERQVGGDHYKGLGDIQHWDVVHKLGWCYLVGAATKYLWRLGRKGDRVKQIEDIGKAIHFLEKKREQLIQENKPAPTVFADTRVSREPLSQNWKRCEQCGLIPAYCTCGKEQCVACVIEEGGAPTGLAGVEHTCGASAGVGYVKQE